MEENKATKEETSMGIDENIAAAIANFPLLGLIFIFTEKKSKLVRFYSFQVVLFAIAYIVLSIVIGCFSVFLFFIPGMAAVIALFNSLLGLAYFLALLFLAFKAYNKEMFKLPFIGDIAEKQAAKPVV